MRRITHPKTAPSNRDGNGRLRRGHRLGKYAIRGVLGRGGFATVYRARDTIEGVDVALKVFRTDVGDPTTLRDFRQEAQIAARLDHDNILPLKDANILDTRLVIATRLAATTLADRMRKRMSTRTALALSEQILAALAHAHERRIIHCDVKPANFLLFADGMLRLADFGISRFALRTLRGSGSGTVGYVAPEQAMGQPSYRSDVFSAGLVIWRLLSGSLPEWPFEDPLPGVVRLRRLVHEDLIGLLRRSLSVSPQSRPKDCRAFHAAYIKILPHAVRTNARRRAQPPTGGSQLDWRSVRFRQFKKHHGRELQARHHCTTCRGPVAETMVCCPWCRNALQRLEGTPRFSRTCPRCARGMKPDWRYCSHCHGPKLPPAGARLWSDKQYRSQCQHNGCSPGLLMPFMRYCPWCRTKVARRWSLSTSRDHCDGCGWGVVKDYWSYCPWCRKRLRV